MTFHMKLFITFLSSGILFAVMMYVQKKKEEKAERLFQLKMEAIDAKYKNIHGEADKNQK